MPLTLVLGPANSAKAGEILGAYSANIPRGAILVVPTREDVAYYSRELAATGTVLGGSVLTFGGLANEIAKRTGYSAKRLSALQRERLVRRATHHAQLEQLAASARGAGFVRAAEALIAELERSLITPQRFTQAMRTWAADSAPRQAYAEEVAGLYAGYARELDRSRRVDAEVFAWRAIDALRAAPAAWGASPVFLYGFDDLTPLERDAIETLSRIAGVEVTVSLTYEPGRRALAARAEAVQELRPLALRVIELPAADDYYEPAARTALHELERRLFEPAADAAAGIEPGEAIRLLEAGGERAEAELVAAEVLSLIDAGTPAEEIVVVHRQLERSAPLYERVFESAGLPTAVGRTVPLSHTSLGRGLLALARCALLPEAQGRASDVLDYLRSPGLLERPEVADALEFRVRREGLATAAQARVTLGWRLGEIDALREADDPLAELARQARRLLAAPHRGAADILAADEVLDAHALATVVRALEDLDELGERPTGGELIAWLESLTVRVDHPARAGAVLLAEPLAIRARRFRAVFVCGLQEGEFPRPGTGEPFLSDERRRELAAASGLRLRPREDALARERYLFYSCVSRASERLILSYRSSDEEGNVALRSPFVADVEDLLVPGWAQGRRRRLLDDVVWAIEEAPTARERARALAVAGAGGAGAGADAAERAGAGAGAGAEASVGAGGTGGVDSGGATRQLGQRALAHVRHSEVVSPGALESFVACPVKWLVERELQPAPFEPDPDPLTRGSFIHAALERVLGRLAASVTPETLPDARRILDEVLDELSGEITIGPGRSPAVRAAMLRAIAADLRRYLEHESASGCDWAQAGLELRFGFDEEPDAVTGRSSLPPLELGPEGARVRLRGVIDRVDTDGAGHAIVRDYKSGRRNPGYAGKRWHEDHQLQVALYMIVVREMMGLEPAAGVYQPLTGDDIRARGVFLAGAALGTGFVGTDAREPEELSADLDDAAAQAVEIGLRLRAGELTPCPETCSRDGCAYPGICRAG